MYNLTDITFQNTSIIFYAALFVDFCVALLMLNYIVGNINLYYSSIIYDDLVRFKFAI